MLLLPLPLLLPAAGLTVPFPAALPVPVPLVKCGVFVITVSDLPAECFLRIHRIRGTADVGLGWANSGGPTKSSNSCGKFA